MASGLSHERKSIGLRSFPESERFDYHREDRNARTISLPLPAAERTVAEILALADIQVNGQRPWDIQVHDQRFFQRVLSYGTLGAGESYMDGWWDVDALDEFFTRVHRIKPYDKIGLWNTLWVALKGRIFNRQTASRAGRVVHEHYDLGNDILRGDAGQANAVHLCLLAGGEDVGRSTREQAAPHLPEAGPHAWHDRAGARWRLWRPRTFHG